MNHCPCMTNYLHTQPMRRSILGFSRVTSPFRLLSIMSRYKLFLSSIQNGRQPSWSHAGLSFLLAHIAYNLALGRSPTSSHPLIVYAQHAWDDRVAKQLVEDFPQTKFLHTIRDPISSCDGVFHYHFSRTAESFPRVYILAPYTALFCLTNKDGPHFGMEPRTRDHTLRRSALRCRRNDA